MISLITKVWRRLIQVWWALVVPMSLRSQGVSLGRKIKFYGTPIISIQKNSSIEISAESVLCSDSRFTALGVNHPVIIRTIRESARITIGRNTGISGSTICAAMSIHIGDDCLIGSGVMIVDNDFHPIAPIGRRSNREHADIAAKPIMIGDNVFIGARSIILKGVTIGANSVVGAGSVVRTSIPPNTIAIGNPAVPARVIEIGSRHE